MMSKPAVIAVVCNMIAIALGTNASAAEPPGGPRWLPTQQPPKGLTRTDFALFADGVSPDGRRASGNLGPEHMLVQSLAGLAAQAVNEGRSDEMVWVGLDNPSYDIWLKAVTERLSLEDRGAFGPWELTQRYVDAGIVKGYVLYRYDYTDGGATDYHPDMDFSVNVATTLAGIHQGVLISECIESKAKAMGLTCLADVRDKSQSWCFEQYKDRVSRRYALAQSPKMPNNRSFAIANRMFAFF